jgi:NADH-quinone oxidoreductase subunit F
VGIIGGGAGAIEAARLAVRHLGSERVFVFCPNTRQEEAGNEDEIRHALEEGVLIEFLTAPVRILASRGKVKSVECVRLARGPADEDGRKSATPITGSEFMRDLQTVITVAGVNPDISFLTKKEGLKTSEAGTLAVDKTSLATSRKGVFAGGDLVDGKGSFVEAMAAGKQAAESIQGFIEGKSPLSSPQLVKPSVYVKPVNVSREELAQADRPEIPSLSPSRRKKNSREVELGLTEEVAFREARRCLRCELRTKAGREALKGADD